MKTLLILVTLLSINAFADLQSDVASLEYLAHNSSHLIRQNSGSVDEESAMAALYQENIDSHCFSAKNAILVKGNESFPRILRYITTDFKRTSMAMEAVNTSAAEVRQSHAVVMQLLTSSENRFVVYSGYNSDSPDEYNAEACTYFRYRIYRKDGQLIELNFDYTD